ncbi:MAG: VacB/RNase II family 3'-5' exoribonuclease [Oceanivirga sp.]|nr:VacB/RNase II family 3'-5' exoribonuclease [Oceanivirga sp.]
MSNKIGELSMTRKGFGFVLNETEKYFVAEKNMNTAAEKDIVEFRVTKYKGRDEAIITKIIKRHTDEFVGTITNSKNFSFVMVDNLSKDVYIKRGSTLKAKEGDIVKIKITNWGTSEKKPEAKVIRIYGKQTATNVVNAMIDSMEISRKFTKEELKFSDDLELPDINYELTKRKDLRNLKHITIDGEDTKDIDDAVYLEKDGTNYILYVSIADVSHYVKEKDLLDNLALKRGNSIYLYDRVIPMLPRRLTNDLCSLNPNENKLAFTVKLVYDKNAKLLDTEIFKSVIVSHKRCTYKEVNDVLNGNTKNHEFEEMLLNMNELSNIMSDISKSRGAMEFEFPELKLILNEEQKLVDIKLRVRDEAEVLIENFMVSANEAVANYLFYANVPAIFRIHEKPSLESMENLNKELVGVGLSVKNPSILTTRLQKIIDKTKGETYGYFLHKLILRSMQKAIYSKDDKGHFGLGLDHYLHFTSPIRRYADLIVHRVLDKSLNTYISEYNKKKIDKKLNYISKHISKTERDAQRLEFDAQSIKLSEYMTDYIGFEYEARVTWIHNERVFVELSNYIEAELLSDKEYKLNTDLKVKVVSTSIQDGKVFVKEV